MCSFLMHLYIHPEVRSTLTIMRYLKFANSKSQQEKRLQNFMVAILKFATAIYTEIILILMMAHLEDISDLIKDFVALGFIIEIDN